MSGIAGGPRMVVGVDGSSGSKLALQWALRIARAEHASIDAVGAWPVPATLGVERDTRRLLPEGRDGERGRRSRGRRVRRAAVTAHAARNPRGTGDQADHAELVRTFGPRPGRAHRAGCAHQDVCGRVACRPERCGNEMNEGFGS